MLVTHQSFSAYTKSHVLASHAARPARRLRVHKNLGMDTARTGDPNLPKGYPITYGVLLSN